jgi:hypothetical protein
VPYLKFSRDKRGYENFFLIEPPSGGRDQHGSKARPRLLFWFRTPPHVKVGRMPFSDEVRAMVEAQNPDLRFDWARITSTPIPSPEADQWRERRRAEKAARRADREEDTAQETTTSAPEDVNAVLDAIEMEAGAAPATAAAEQGPAEATPPASDSEVAAAHEQRRRRRRRRRRHGHHDAAAQPQGAEPAAEATTVQQDAALPDETPPSGEV